MLYLRCLFISHLLVCFRVQGCQQFLDPHWWETDCIWTRVSIVYFYEVFSKISLWGNHFFNLRIYFHSSLNRESISNFDRKIRPVWLNTILILLLKPAQLTKFYAGYNMSSLKVMQKSISKLEHAPLQKNHFRWLKVGFQKASKIR